MTIHTLGTSSTRDALSKPIPLTLASQHDLGDSPYKRAENFRNYVAAILLSGTLIGGGVVVDRLMRPSTNQGAHEQVIPTSSKQKPVNQSATNVATNNQTPSVK